MAVAAGVGFSVGETLASLASTKRAVLQVDPALLDGARAAELLEAVADAERALAMTRTRLAARVAESNVWKRHGHRSAAHHLAATTGTTVSAAIGVLETATALEELPELREAFEAGAVSEAQAREVAVAASRAPEAEAELVALAQREGVESLRRRCRSVQRGGAAEIERHERIRAHRYLRRWTDTDGAFCMSARTTADDGARIWARLEAELDVVFHEARRAGRREPRDAYAIDALTRICDTPAGDANSRPPASVHVRVDHAALQRGHVEGGEVCEIPGVGPIPVATARAMLDDAILSVLVTKGADIVATAYAGRTIPAATRRLVEARDLECIVPGCGARDHLEIDHNIPHGKHGPPTAENLARLCKWHHYLKTHHGYTYTGPPGRWQWHPPDHPAEGDPGIERKAVSADHDETMPRRC